MKYDLLLQKIIDIADGLQRNGAETYRIEESLYRMCESYGYKQINLFVIPSTIQVTVTSPEGDIISQSRHIDKTVINYNNLDKLNDLCRFVCANTPDFDELTERIDGVTSMKPQTRWVTYVAGILGCAGYTAFFGGKFLDTIIGIIVAVIIVFTEEWLSKLESNLLIYNASLSFVAEIVILAASYCGFCPHPERVTMGFVMLLVSGLGVTNGIREFIQRDFLSGSIHVMDSVLGASGIALGILLPMLFIHDIETEGHVLAYGLAPQAISCFIGCLGFALWFKIKGRDVLISAVGGSLTWIIYSIVHSQHYSNFLATLVASIFVALFAFAASRICKVPSTLFHSVAAFPLIPGGSLYIMMFHCAIADMHGAMDDLIVLVVTCLGIAFGFNIVNVFERNYIRFQQMKRNRKTE